MPMRKYSGSTLPDTLPSSPVPVWVAVTRSVSCGVHKQNLIGEVQERVGGESSVTENTDRSFQNFGYQQDTGGTV